MSNRTYTEAVDLMVEWWIEKSFKTLLNQNNGDDSENGGMAFMLMNMNSMRAKEDLTDDKIEAFKNKLTSLLLEKEGKGRWHNELSVDYHPNQILGEACQSSEIDSGCLPCKTNTYINDDNEVEGSFQYGGAWFKL